MDEIIIVIGNILLALILCVIYFFLTCNVIPRFTMHLVIKKSFPPIRGLKRVVFEDGRGVICLPEIRVRKYIPEYAVLEKDRTKLLQCKLVPQIERLRYDVVSFDRRGRLLDIVSVSEKVQTRGIASPVLLPTKTAYAGIVLRRVDAMPVKRAKVFTYSWIGIALYVTLTLLTCAITASTIFDCIQAFTFSSARPLISSDLVTIVAVLGGLLTAGITLLSYYIHSFRVINK